MDESKRKDMDRVWHGVKSHGLLDLAVDAAYGKRRFANDPARVAYLFDLYNHYTMLLPAASKPGKSRRRVKA